MMTLDKKKEWLKKNPLAFHGVWHIKNDRLHDLMLDHCMNEISDRFTVVCWQAGLTTGCNVGLTIASNVSTNESEKPALVVYYFLSPYTDSSEHTRKGSTARKKITHFDHDNET